MVGKQVSRRITADIRRVLLDVWDPIGVGDEPNAQDEYDCCLGGLYQLLIDGASVEEIQDYLWKQATGHMGLTVPKEGMTPTVKALRRVSLV
jgi:hypothetical protein